MSETHALSGEPVARPTPRLITQEGASTTTFDVTVVTGPTFKQISLAQILQQMGVATGGGATPPAGGTTLPTTQPATPSEGSVWFDPAGPSLEIYDGSAWVSVSLS